MLWSVPRPFLSKPSHTLDILTTGSVLAVVYVTQGYQGMVDGGENIKEEDWKAVSGILQQVLSHIQSLPAPASDVTVQPPPANPRPPLTNVTIQVVQGLTSLVKSAQHSHHQPGQTNESRITRQSACSTVEILELHDAECCSFE